MSNIGCFGALQKRGSYEDVYFRLEASSLFCIEIPRNSRCSCRLTFSFHPSLGALDHVLQTEPQSLRSPIDGFHFRVVSTWTQCLQQCFNPQIVIGQLSDQFVQLFFKLLSRFEHWLSDKIETAESNLIRKGNSHLVILGIQNDPSIKSSFHNNEDLALFERDLKMAKRILETHFYLMGLRAGCHEALERAVASFLSRLEGLQERMIRLIIQRLVQESNAIVKKSVSTAVSTMLRPGGDRPTVPNDYIKRKNFHLLVLNDEDRFSRTSSVLFEFKYDL